MTGKKLLGMVAVVVGIVAVMALFDIGILWLIEKLARAIWGFILWAAESLYWAVTSLFEVGNRSIDP